MLPTVGICRIGWLWPISLFNGILEPDNAELKYYYPTSTLVTGPDIIFFWVAMSNRSLTSHMVASSLAWNHLIAIDALSGCSASTTNVYFTGIVRDKIGRKMSKQFGNSPDPLQLVESGLEPLDSYRCTFWLLGIDNIPSLNKTECIPYFVAEIAALFT